MEDSEGTVMLANLIVDEKEEGKEDGDEDEEVEGEREGGDEVKGRLVVGLIA